MPKFDATYASFRDFDRLLFEGDLNAQISVDGEFNVRIDGDREATELVEFRLNGREMTVTMPDTKRRCSSRSVTVFVTMPKLVAVSCLGSGTTFVNNLTADLFQAQLMGSGSLNLVGRTENAKLTLHGSGDLNASKLMVHKLAADLTGSGTLTAHATEQVSAHLVGSGSLTVGGKPNKVTKVSSIGSGRLQII